MKKALVTGAAGFIGSNVVRELLGRNVNVRALVFPGEKTANLDGLDVERVVGDVLDPSAVHAAVKGCDTVFHLAAIYAIWLRDRKRIYDVNLDGSNNVLWAAWTAGVEKVVYTSSIAALGVAPGERSSNEETAFNQLRYGNDYVLTKYLSEQNALAFARNGLPLVVVNPAFPFGEGDVGPTPTGKLLVDTVNGKFPGTIEAGINVIDVRDVARGHVLAAEKGRPGERYILGNHNAKVKDFAMMISRIARVPIRTFRIPVALMAWTGYALEKIADHVTHKPPLLTYKVARYSAQYLFYDNTKARTELGLELTPIEQSVERSIAWFRQRGYINR